MRIVGGIHKGRRLTAPKGIDVRPTLEKIREAIFNILAHGLTEWTGDLKGAIVLDLFCGTGAFGIEALSRGAAHVTFLEQSGPILAATKRNAALGIEAVRRTTFLKLDATILPPPPRVSGYPCDIVFLDPPYGKSLASSALVGLKRQRWLAPGALAIVETSVEDNFLQPSGYKIIETRTYGVTSIIFLKLSE